MSSIKPPSGITSGAPPAIEGGPARGAAGAQPSDTFRTALDASEPAAGARQGGTAARNTAAAPGAGAELIGDLRAGRTSPAAVVQTLLERTLGQADASGLPPARRVALEALLRDALANDPTLQQLTKDLERGR